MRVLNTEPETIPTAADYRAGLSAVRANMTDNQFRMLQAHYFSSGHSMTARHLAAAVGFAGWHGANLQYGRFAGILADAMDVEVQGDLVFLLATFKREAGVADNEVQLVMRPPVIEALADLGWFNSASTDGPPPSSPDTPYRPLWWTGH